jgi:molecular chaperone Hsp33
MEAGGFIIQLMPETTDETIGQLEANISNLPSVTSMLADGLTPEEILEKVLEGMDLEITARMDAKFKCDCSRERVERSLISLSDEDLDEIISDDKPVEVRCQFCNKAYNFTIPEMKELKEMRIQAREERHKARQERIQELQEKQKNKNK